MSENNQPTASFIQKLIAFLKFPPVLVVLVVMGLGLVFSIYLVAVMHQIAKPNPANVTVLESNEVLDPFKVFSRDKSSIELAVLGVKKREIPLITPKLESKSYLITKKKNNDKEQFILQDSNIFIPRKINTTMYHYPSRDSIYRKETKNGIIFITKGPKDTVYFDDFAFQDYPAINTVIQLDRKHLIFAENPLLLSWVIFISLLNATSWILGIIFIVMFVMYLKRLPGYSQRNLLLIPFALAIMAIYFYLTQCPSIMIFNPMEYHEICATLKVLFNTETVKTMFNWVTIPVEVCGLLALGCLLTLPFLSENAMKDESLKDWKQKAGAQTEIKNEFVKLVIFMSGLILMGMFSNMLMRDVISNRLGKDFDFISPAYFTWAYGLKYSIILGFCYFPVYYYLNYNRIKLRGEILLGGTAPAEVDKELGSIGTSQKFWDRSKIIIAALAPLLGTAGKELFDFAVKLLN